MESANLEDMVKEYKDLKRSIFRKDGEFKANASTDKISRYEVLKNRVGHMEETKTDNDPEDYAAKREKLTDEDVVMIERNIRRGVKRQGGYRKGLDGKVKEECIRWLKLLDRDTEKPVWNLEIRVPGFDY